MKLRICCISDTHTYHKKVKIPDCDILIHAGDYTGRGGFQEVESFLMWLSSQDQALFKIFVSGNHDINGDSKYNTETGADMWWPELFEEYNINRPDSTIFYLDNSSINLLGLNIWGSPYTIDFLPEQWAYNLPADKIPMVWDMIPENTDITITHMPPAGIRDFFVETQTHLGCESLRSRLKLIKPKLSVFAHIHDGYGMEEHDGTIYVNAATCNEQYRPVNKPILIEIDI